MHIVGWSRVHTRLWCSSVSFIHVPTSKPDPNFARKNCPIAFWMRLSEAPRPIFENMGSSCWHDRARLPRVARSCPRLPVEGIAAMHGRRPTLADAAPRRWMATGICRSHIRSSIMDYRIRRFAWMQPAGASRLACIGDTRGRLRCFLSALYPYRSRNA